MHVTTFDRDPPIGQRRDPVEFLACYSKGQSIRVTRFVCKHVAARPQGAKSADHRQHKPHPGAAARISQMALPSSSI
jgi:hypothetical protein